MQEEKPLASSLCEQTTGRLMRINLVLHQSAKQSFWTKLTKEGLQKKK